LRIAAHEFDEVGEDRLQGGLALAGEFGAFGAERLRLLPEQRQYVARLVVANVVRRPRARTDRGRRRHVRRGHQRRGGRGEESHGVQSTPLGKRLLHGVQRRGGRLMPIQPSEFSPQLGGLRFQFVILQAQDRVLKHELPDLRLEHLFELL